MKIDENPYFQMLNIAESLGINLIPKEKQYQLLACAHMYGDECIVFNPRLFSDIMFSARCNNIHEAGTPDRETICKIRKYEQEIRSGEKPDFVLAIEEDYNVQFSGVI